MALLNRKMSDEEREHLEELAEEQERRLNRFRILVCIDGSDECYESVKLAADIGRSDECDIVLLYVRRIDQGLNTGGLQIRVARQNMLDWGLELPGIEYLKKGLSVLESEGYVTDEWKSRTEHVDVFGDPVGDNKVEYVSPSGKSIVLKLKIAFDVARGILDQYELGPYNLIISGAPKRWSGKLRSLRDPSTVQKLALLAPCSVMARRDSGDRTGVLIHVRNTRDAFVAMQQAAVLAHHCGEEITLISAAKHDHEVEATQAYLSDASRQLEGMGIKVEKLLSPVGDPAATIIEAGKDYKMIAVSDSSKTRIRRFITGSVAFNVMGGADTTVLNVR